MTEPLERCLCCNCRGHSEKTALRAVIKLLFRQQHLYSSLKSSFRSPSSSETLSTFQKGSESFFPCPKPQRWLPGERENSSGQTELPATQTAHQSAQQRDKQLWRTNIERGENPSDKRTREDESVLKMSWPSSPRPACPQQKGRTKKEGGRRQRGFFQPPRALTAKNILLQCQEQDQTGMLLARRAPSEPPGAL